MSAKDTLHGMNCPNCAGMVPIPEGQAIVQCPYCDLRSFVRGERGLRRYQAPRRVDREHAAQAWRGFLTSSMAIARNAAKQARLQEAFVAYLPFWASWAHVMGWVFGQEKVGSGDDTRYEPREVKIAQDMVWNGAACDVGEFGVQEVSLYGKALEPFDYDGLHASGMVFEPIGSESEARQSAQRDFLGRVRSMADLDKVAQVFVRQVRERMGLVYYPLWIMRYLYRGRSFQVVVDGNTGQVLYGKAPGNTWYRAAVLVGGMALGALLAVDGAAGAGLLAFNVDDGEGTLALLGVAGGAVVAGAGLMLGAYRKFRYGEEYEYARHLKKKRRTKRKKRGGVWQAREVRS